MSTYRVLCVRPTYNSIVSQLQSFLVIVLVVRAVIQQYTITTAYYIQRMGEYFIFYYISYLLEISSVGTGGEGEGYCAHYGRFLHHADLEHI